MDLIKESKKIGAIAYQSGKKCIPSESNELMKLLENQPNNVTPLMDGFITGWTLAKLSEGCGEDFPSVKEIRKIFEGC